LENPKADIVGIDLSGVQIDEGNRIIEYLGLENIRLIHQNVLEFDKKLSYIVGKITNNKYNDVYIDSQGCQYIKITEDYKQVKDNLFEDKQGNLYIQGTNNMIFYYSRPIYISELYAMNSDKLKIKDIVDRDTYEKLADTGFSKDKQFLYLLKEWSDRWELHIISKDPNKYKLIWKNCRYYLYSDGKYYLNQDVFTEEELNMPQK